MNRVALLLFLVLVVPVQIYFNYIANNVDHEEEEEPPASMKSSPVSLMFKRLEDTLIYYSTLEHLKEFVLVPHHPKQRSLKKKFQSMINYDPTTGSKMLSFYFSDNDEETKKSTKSNKKVNSGSKSSSQGGKQHQLSSLSSSGRDHDTSEAVEVEQHNEKSVYFSRSSTPRTHRPAHLKYRVGDVVRHTMDGYYGVVVGWDLKCQAPQWWLKKHGYSNNQGILTQPHYLVLVESNDDNLEVLYYLPQLDIEKDQIKMIKSGFIENYFDQYSTRTGTYLPQKWLKERYPADQQQ